MLSEARKNAQKKGVVFVRGIVVSISTMMLAACANHAKDIAATAPTKTGSEQVKAYSVIPATKPAIARFKKTAERENGIHDKIKEIGEVAYLSPSERAYKKVGRASWYGAAFNGRLTANGEIYDMHNLTAAHPTMPLPSYARVTNLENGASLIVRVNDRGPFAADRVIDLSKQAATMLDYKDDGLADVKVEYVGRAPIEGNDNEFLMASYKPGNITPDTLLAMAGVNLNSPVADSATQAMEGFAPASVQSTYRPEIMRVTYPELPEIGPLPAFKPDNSQLLAFADETSTNSRQEVFNSVLNSAGNDKPSGNIMHSKTGASAKTAKPVMKGEMNDATHKTIDDENVRNPAKSMSDVAENSGKKADRALELAWATGVSEAFSIGSEH